MIIGAGIVRAALDITEGRSVNAAEILTPHKLGDVIVVSLLTGIATFIGLILCVLPGLAVMFFTSFTLYFLMDREELGAIDAIKASFEFTKNNAGNVILWFLLSLATWFVGALLCGVGLIAAVPRRADRHGVHLQEAHQPAGRRLIAHTQAQSYAARSPGAGRRTRRFSRRA